MRCLWNLSDTILITYTVIYSNKKKRGGLNFAHKVYLCVPYDSTHTEFSDTILISIFPTETLCTSCEAKPDLYRMLMKFRF